MDHTRQGKKVMVSWNLALATFLLGTHAVTVSDTNRQVSVVMNVNDLSTSHFLNISDEVSTHQDERPLALKRNSMKTTEYTLADCFDAVFKQSIDGDRFFCLQFPLPLLVKNNRCCQYCPYKNPFWPADKCMTVNPAMDFQRIDYYATRTTSMDCDDDDMMVTFEIDDLAVNKKDKNVMKLSKCYSVTTMFGKSISNMITGFWAEAAADRETLPTNIYVTCDADSKYVLTYYSGGDCSQAMKSDTKILNGPLDSCQDLSTREVKFATGDDADTPVTPMKGHRNFQIEDCPVV